MNETIFSNTAKIKKKKKNKVEFTKKSTNSDRVVIGSDCTYCAVRS